MPLRTASASHASVLGMSIRVLQAVMNWIFVLLFIFLAVASYHRFAISGSVLSFGVLAVNILFLVLYLTRRRAIDETTSLKLWILAFFGTTASLLLRPTAHSGPAVGYVIQIIGFTILATALLSLRRSFAIVPANRGIRQGGLYRVVRHPVYLAELIVILGVVLTNPTLQNLSIWICECLLQFARARAEERFLLVDPVYQSYCERVHYRLLPGLV